MNRRGIVVILSFFCTLSGMEEQSNKKIIPSNWHQQSLAQFAQDNALDVGEYSNKISGSIAKNTVNSKDYEIFVAMKKIRKIISRKYDINNTKLTLNRDINLMQRVEGLWIETSESLRRIQFLTPWGSCTLPFNQQLWEDFQNFWNYLSSEITVSEEETIPNYHHCYKVIQINKKPLPKANFLQNESTLCDSAYIVSQLLWDAMQGCYQEEEEKAQIALAEQEEKELVALTQEFHFVVVEE